MFVSLCDFLMRHSDNAAMFEQRREEQKAAEARRVATKPVGYGELRMKVASAEKIEAPIIAPVVEAEIVAEPPPAPPPPLVGKQPVVKPAEPPPVVSAQETALSLVTPPPPVVRKRRPKPKPVSLPMVAEPVMDDLAIAKAAKLQKPLPIPAAPQKVISASAIRRTAAATVATPAQQDMFSWLGEGNAKGEGEVALSFGFWMVMIVVAAAAICGAYFLSRMVAGLL
jgi:hypothetical protein